MKFSKQFFPRSGCGNHGLHSAAFPALAAQLGADARSAIPNDVQQLIVVDYRVMQNSPAAMNLKARVLPPELKQWKQRSKRPASMTTMTWTSLPLPPSVTANTGDSTKIVGIAQGQFSLPDILANFKKQKVKAT